MTIYIAICGSANAAAGKKSLYGQQIVVETKATTAAKDPSVELAHCLEQITGVPFGIANRATDNSPGAIYLLNADSTLVAAADRARLKGKGLEAFLIRGDSSELRIIANDVRGLTHGSYYYLEQLGVRWLLPGANWTVVPKRGDVTLTIDRLVEPDFFARAAFGTGGFYSNNLGRLYTGSAESRKSRVSEFEHDATAWQRHLRFGGQSLGHAMGESFVSDRAITPILAAHPEYLAKIDGKYSPLFIPAPNGAYVWDADSNRYVKAVPPRTGTHKINVIVKLNAGNPDAVKLFSDWILTGLRRVRKSPDGYACRTTSVEPSDGTGEGNNYAELKAQGVGDGSESDQEFYIANQCARAVQAEFPDVSVVMLAYAQRTDPPTFDLEPNFIVQPAFAFRFGHKTASLTNDEWLDAWSKKARTMAVYDFWSIPDWSHGEPTFNYLGVAKKLRDFHAKNIKGLQAESTNSGGAMGLGQYVAAHLMWDIHLDERALIEDWYDNAFGPAKAPMKRMLERWAQSYRPLSSELGESYRDLAAAERLAEGNPAVVARVDDFGRYLHYLRLRDELLDTPGAPNGDAKTRKSIAIAEYLFDINDSRMVHTTRNFDLMRNPAVFAEFHLHDPAHPDDPPDGPGWARVHPLSHDEVAALIADGLKTYQAPDFTVKKFTGKLVPLKPTTWTPPTGDPWGPGMMLGVRASPIVDLQILPGLASFPLRIGRIERIKTVTVSDDSGRTVYTHTLPVSTAVGKNDWRNPSTWDQLDIPLAPGHYRVHFGPGTNFFQTWKGVPLIFSGNVVPQKAWRFPRLYFYVPRGLEKIAIYFPDTDRAGGFDTPVFMPDGARAKTESRDGGKLMIVSVPAGQDGKIWSLDRVVQPDNPFEMLNVPQQLSLSPEVLMVPSDALE